MPTIDLRKLIIIAVAGQAFIAGAVSAQQIVVDEVFHIREQRSANDIGIGIGQRVSFGAVSVVPNGGAGTTGVAQQGSEIRPLIWSSDPLSPNFFSNATSDVSLTGQWTLTFMNPCCPNAVVQTPTTTTTPPPFVENVTISGSGLTPTFSWTLPSGFVPDDVTVLIRDKRLGQGAVQSDTLAADATSYTPPAILETGGALDPNNTDCYVFEVRLVERRNDLLPPTLSNTLGRSRSFVNFCATEDDLPPEGVFIPAIDQNGILTFNIDVDALDPVILDPVVAIGYHFATEAGNPNFAFVTLPEVGDNVFSVTYDDGGPVTDTIVAGQTLFFPAAGVNQFTVTGIEPAAALDPANPLVFMASVAFVANGKFTGSMTPITFQTGPNSARVDIMPSSDSNPVNTKNKGLLPVALLGSQTLDVTALSGISAIFGPGEASIVHDLSNAATLAAHIGDVNGDGFPDLTLHFNIKDVGFAIGDTAACLLVVADQGEFGGCDAVNVIK